MGYCEIKCQLCGVSFAIARLRRADEPPEAAWDYTGSGFVDHQDWWNPDGTCTESSGCKLLKREARFEGHGPGKEHIAGPGCGSGLGYTGHRISLEEMKGCRAVQCLVRKGSGWKPEPDDQDFELESNYFLTGIGDGSPDEAPLENIKPVRHGFEYILISNIYCESDDEDWGFPFHPTCFEIFKKVSKLRLRSIDAHGLLCLSNLKTYHDTFSGPFPPDFEVSNAKQQWWQHEPGSEYLVANPVEVPSLPSLLRTCHRYPQTVTTGDKPSNANHSVFSWTYKGPNDSSAMYHRTPPPVSSARVDPFTKLPGELASMVLDHLSSKDIANLRLATPVFRQLSTVLFRRLLLEDMPWLWEAQNMPVAKTDWYKLYMMVKFCWINLKGLRNRKRIWKVVEEVVRKIGRYRKEGKIRDE